MLYIVWSFSFLIFVGIRKEIIATQSPSFTRRFTSFASRLNLFHFTLFWLRILESWIKNFTYAIHVLFGFLAIFIIFNQGSWRMCINVLFTHVLVHLVCIQFLTLFYWWVILTYWVLLRNFHFRLLSVFMLDFGLRLLLVISRSIKLFNYIINSIYIQWNLLLIVNIQSICQINWAIAILTASLSLWQLHISTA